MAVGVFVAVRVGVGDLVLDGVGVGVGVGCAVLEAVGVGVPSESFQIGAPIVGQGALWLADKPAS